MDKKTILEKSFGEKLPDIYYRDRIGAYGIAFDNENRIPVVKTSTGFFLLGGGIEKDETHEECIKRECLEEAGLIVEVKEFICKGDKYHWSDTLKYYMHGIGYFYNVEVIKKDDIQTEADHRVVWLTVDECCEKLFLEHQAWAVRQAASLYGK
jgi:8-oxo-dGTP diphosphatase